VFWTRWAFKGSDRDLITAVIGPRESGWHVTWATKGRGLHRLAAATVTEVTEQAAAAAVQHYLRTPARLRATHTDFQIALFPHDYTDGPIFDISGEPGALTGSDTSSGQQLHGATLEDLLEAAESASDLRAGHYMFQWIRPVTALSGTTTADAGPAS
jgi:hypothetical protein